MPIDTHSGALSGFHLLPAIEHAKEDEFDGVQLYVNTEILELETQQQIVAQLSDSNLSNVVFHLPDYNNITTELVAATEAVIAQLPPTMRWHALIHLGYRQGQEPFELKYSQVPTVAGRAVSIENSKTGVFDKDHVIRAASLAKSLNAGFVFDIGRILYPDDEGIVDEVEIYNFISTMIGMLNPQTDIIHTAGKLAWEKRFRDAACAFGAEGDITYPLKEAILKFHNAGGIVVFEHEDREMILQSRKNLLTEA